jgi:small nuclear ribonucleoprotein (snRNP)-like protein
MDLEKHVSKRLRIKFAGGREGACPPPPRRGGEWAPQACTPRHPPHSTPARHPSVRPRAPAVVGVLKGFDQLVNIVLDDTTEYITAPGGAGDASASTSTTTRYLGLVVCRGPNITVVGPDDGMQEIANPFLAVEE